MLMNLNNFKTINNTQGHAAGDQALEAVATCLKVAVRSSDVVGRLGGDEFVIVVLNVITRAELDQLAQRIHTALAQPTRIGNNIMGLRASIGIVILDKDDTRDSAQILHDADTAMYAAKHAGGGTTRYFTNTPTINGVNVIGQ